MTGTVCGGAHDPEVARHQRGSSAQHQGMVGWLGGKGAALYDHVGCVDITGWPSAVCGGAHDYQVVPPDGQLHGVRLRLLLLLLLLHR
jgi:hypothetical protein